MNNIRRINSERSVLLQLRAFRRPGSLALLAALALCRSAASQCPIDELSVVPLLDASIGGLFALGNDLALTADGQIALLTDDSDDEIGFQAGAVHIMARSGDVWIPQQKLLAPDGSQLDFFGSFHGCDRTLASRFQT